MEIIKNITAVESFLVRQPVLRPEKSLESCHFDGDNLETTKHFGLFIDEKLIGIVSVFTSKNSAFTSTTQFQIRGMAVLPKFQKQGFGEKLMRHSEEYILNQKGTLTWFNARENAVPFYEKLHYKKVGPPFVIADIGLHYLMKKEIIYPPN